MDLNVFIHELQAALLSIKDKIEQASGPDYESLDSAEVETEALLSAVISLEASLSIEGYETIIGAIGDIFSSIQGYKNVCQRSRRRGRPQIPISEEQLDYLLELHFSSSELARFFCVSSRTIQRRIIQYGLDEVVAYTDLPDEALDEITSHFVMAYPNSGGRSLAGFLRGSKLRVQRQRVRDSLVRVDPRGVHSRFREVLHRRVYNVTSPNSLWHIDGYHKLIKWRIVIHGGIDGYSRLPVYLKASDNNRSDTVLECFVGAVSKYGLPSRVRCDKGGENVLVSEYVLSHPLRGPGRRSSITG